MKKRQVLGLGALLLGLLFGHAVASGKVAALLRQEEEKPAEPAKAPPPGSPSATTTIDGRYLPPPPPKFGGQINLNAAQSKPWWPPRVVPSKGAPNILLILTDDVGFGASSTFGGPIQTPNFQRLADNGLRYNQFHTTALCSPTRACFITGRNHHSVASGVITEFATGYPGYNSLVPKSAGSVGAVLRASRMARSSSSRAIVS